ncbi:MAG: alanine--tRNA ligase, partial [Planctomycetes bacterium]|nr:alanine--tRNA ligase [Planctomycetota bacterium]
MKANDLRQAFLDFFRVRGHEVVHSSPVVPVGDTTLLFANAGMNQFKDVFLGRTRRAAPRATTAQKCIRAGGKHNDLENVGATARHHTFFEMLGNFSFGDYFKREAIDYAWQFLTVAAQIPPSRLSATVYRDDEEAHRLWREVVGIPGDRVHRLGEKENFWSMGDTGPCGPCTELIYDRGAERACGEACGIGSCDCDRWLEVWNLVFMEFDQAADGTRTRLPRPCVDTGMGLERLASVLQGADSNFGTDLLVPLLHAVEAATGVPYRPGPEGMPHRVIADHVRALAFAIADGASIGNEGRGYVLRRILRRASRYGRKLGGSEPFIHGLVGVLSRLMGEAYPELREAEPRVVEAIRAEEEAFHRTVDRGIEHFESVALGLGPGGVFPGEEAFYLHDTLGFPVDLVQVMAREHGLGVDLEGFGSLLAAQRERARSASRFGAAAGPDLTVLARRGFPATEFVGYERTALDGVRALGLDGDHLVLEATPFYAEGGGQVADQGEVLLEGGEALHVVDVQREGDWWVHRVGGAVPAGEFRVAAARVDVARRRAVARHHTATHLAHWALREVLGAHVRQQGSLVEPGRLRFDVSHGAPVDEATRREVERRVNERVVENLPLRCYVTGLEEALASGVIAFFGDKYGDRVRVVDIGGYSRELCGGTHCERTGDIGAFFFTGEGSVAAGVRRVEAVTGPAALEAARSLADRTEAESATRLEALRRELKALRAARQQEAARDAVGLARDLAWAAPRPGGVRAVVAEVPGAGAEELRKVVDALRSGGEPTACVLAGVADGRVVLVAAGTRDVADGRRFHAGAILK